jgi:hypothetical protein
MRRLVAWLFGGLPFDPRSRRAIDETLLDWAKEETEAGPGRRWLVGLSGLLAIGRAAVVAASRETTSVPLWWLLKRSALFVVLPATVLSLPMVLPLLGTESAWRIPGVLAITAPEWLPTVAPLGLLLCLMWRPRHVHVQPIGTAIVVGAAMLVFLGWILPHTNEFLVAVYARPLADVLGPLSLRYVDEATLIDLLRSTHHPVAVSVLLRITGFAALAATSVVLAESLYRRIALRKLDWIAAVPLAYMVTSGIVSGMVQTVLPGGIGATGTAWVQATLVLLVAGAIQRRTSREQRAIGS